MPDYSSEPPIATAGQLIAISDKINDLCKSMDKLAEMPQKIERMNMQLEQMNKDHQQTRHDLQQARNSFELELEKIQKDVDELKTSKTRIDTLGDWFKWGGISLIGVFVAGWTNLSTKVDMTTAQSANNTQRIEVTEKTQEERRIVLGDMQKKISDLQLDFYKRGGISEDR